MYGLVYTASVILQGINIYMDTFHNVVQIV